jgi:hypothetical protein
MARPIILSTKEFPGGNAQVIDDRPNGGSPMRLVVTILDCTQYVEKPTEKKDGASNLGADGKPKRGYGPRGFVNVDLPDSLLKEVGPECPRQLGFQFMGHYVPQTAKNSGGKATGGVAVKQLGGFGQTSVGAGEVSVTRKGRRARAGAQ